jgi:hypothetical protein
MDIIILTQRVRNLLHQPADLLGICHGPFLRVRVLERHAVEDLPQLVHVLGGEIGAGVLLGLLHDLPAHVLDGLGEEVARGPGRAEDLLHVGLVGVEAHLQRIGGNMDRLWYIVFVEFGM